MGNRFSKKRYAITCNFHEIFSSFKLISEDKASFEEREHLGHAIVREIFDGNFSSPIQNILLDKNSKVLDVGCGPGFWLMEMAADFPNPSYVGIDKLPIFPKSTFPNNVKFIQNDILNGIPFEDNTFDYVHMQFLVCDFTELQWETVVYQELARVLKPGGWLEISDPEFEFMNSGPISKQINSAVCNNLLSRNVNPLIIERHHSLIKSIPTFSSTSVHYERRDFPCFISYANKIGKLGHLHSKESCRCILRGPVGKYMNIKKNEINSFIEKLSDEFEFHQTYFNVYRFYAQKC